MHYLEEQGCQIVARNWRCAAGEADIIIRDETCLAFVEVRTRRGQRYGSPEESITPQKLAHMAAVAQTYVYEREWTRQWRLDVIAILVQGRRLQSIEWYRNVSL